MSLAERIRDKWDYEHYPRVPEITTAASLAHHGLLRSVKYMRLDDVDLASVPAEQLASLAACVTEGVMIRNVSNTDLTSILDSSKSRVLQINKQILSTEETLALVRAMGAGLERVWLGLRGKVTLDISTLVTYSGQGKCKTVGFYNNTAVQYREVLRWAQRISWRVTRDESKEIIIGRY